MQSPITPDTKDFMANLPGELRNEIYEQLLMFLNTKGAIDTEKIEQAAGLLGVSKQYHEEATSYIYARHEFTLKSADHSKETGPLLFIPTVAPRYLQHVSRVTIEAVANHPDSKETSESAILIRKVAKLQANQLSTVKIVVTGVELSGLARDRFDDCVLTSSHPVFRAIQELLRAHTASKIAVEFKDSWLEPGGCKVLAGGREGLFAEEKERALRGRYCFEPMGLGPLQGTEVPEVEGVGGDDNNQAAGGLNGLQLTPDIMYRIMFNPFGLPGMF